MVGETGDEKEDAVNLSACYYHSTIKCLSVRGWGDNRNNEQRTTGGHQGHKRRDRPRGMNGILLFY